MPENHFFRTNNEFLPEHRPQRVYGLVDQQEDDRLFIEAIDADWLTDRLPNLAGFETWIESSHDAPIYVLETSLSQLRIQIPWLPPLGLDGISEEEGSSWIEFVLNPNGDQDLLYNNLFADGVSTSIEKANAVDTETANILSQLFDLSSHEADENEIRTALGNLLQKKIEWIGVYDVGQGSANGLCDYYGMPLAYFDLGGGVLANKGTFPSALTDFCKTAKPPVILSHWDYDHWSSGNRFPDLQELDWIVPNQKLGAVHATFAANVVLKGNLLVWPPILADTSVGQVTIEKCTGRGRNHSGLAVKVDGPNDELPILMTGDARYNVIPSGFGNYSSVVVPHHGADMRNRSTPVCPKQLASRIVYSYGLGNSFSHPRSITYDDHQAQRWDHRHLAPAGIDLHSKDRGPSGLGHIGLNWDPTRTAPLAMPCTKVGGRCSLDFEQS